MNRIKRPNGPFAPHDASARLLMNRRRFLKSGAAAAGAAAAGLSWPGGAKAADKMTFLGWCDHGDPRLLSGFTEKTGVVVDFKSYEGTGAGLAIKEQSAPGDWDLFCLDMQDNPMVAGLGVLEPLDESVVPWDKYFPAMRDQSFIRTGGSLYGVPDKFGYYGVAYNKKKVDPEDAKTAHIMYNPKYKGRIAVYDYYFPVMQLVGLGEGIVPADITVDNLESAIRPRLLELKANAGVVGDILTVLNALYTESADMIIASAEWGVALDMASNPDLDYQIFQEGGLLWNEGLSIFADSNRKDTCYQFIDHALSPEGQRYLATSECYWALPVRTDAPLSDEEKRILRWDQQEEMLARSYPSSIGTPDVDAAMLDLWTEFLAS